MAYKYGAAIGVLVLLGWGAGRAAAENREQRQITWEGLPVLVGQKVRIAMPDGAHIEGKATGVEADALAVDIRKTTNKAAYPTGRFLVPRAILRAVDVSHPSGHWRVVGVGVGGGIGVLMGVLAAGLSGFHNDQAEVGALTAGAIGIAAGGYALGRMADRRTITYVIAQ
jgi:hypothetical protein